MLHHGKDGQRLSYTVERAGPRRRSRCPSSSRRSAGAQHRPLLLPGGGRHLHARRRHRRAPPAAGQPRDAALLLAVGRVLRGVRLLGQRPVRPPRLGLLLGQRDRGARAAAAVPALHAVLPRAPGQLDRQRGRAARWPADLPARAAAGRRARRRPRAGIGGPAVLRQHGRPAGWSESSRCTCRSAWRPASSSLRRRSARCARSPRAGSCAGLPGARRWGRCPSRSATRCRLPSASIRRSRCSCRSSR